MTANVPNITAPHASEAPAAADALIPHAFRMNANAPMMRSMSGGFASAEPNG